VTAKASQVATVLAAVVAAAAASADLCPKGGDHDPADADRPCPRCGASGR
jgi:hypothetical protein